MPSLETESELRLVPVAAPRCDTCAAFCALHNQCRANPPTAAVVMSAKGPLILGAFPAVSAGDWCLKHEPRGDV